jgi:hypothetical protein
MKLPIAVAATVLLLNATAFGQTRDPFSRQSRWAVEESWNTDKLIYTFEPSGKFTSSKESGGKGVGTWMRDGNAFVMLWPLYDNAIYVGTTSEREIRGAAFTKNGKSFGKFVLRLMQ